MAEYKIKNDRWMKNSTRHGMSITQMLLIVLAAFIIILSGLAIAADSGLLFGENSVSSGFTFDGESGLYKAELAFTDVTIKLSFEPGVLPSEAIAVAKKVTIENSVEDEIKAKLEDGESLLAVESYDISFYVDENVLDVSLKSVYVEELPAGSGEAASNTAAEPIPMTTPSAAEPETETTPEPETETTPEPEAETTPAPETETTPEPETETTPEPEAETTPAPTAEPAATPTAEPEETTAPTATPKPEVVEKTYTEIQPDASKGAVGISFVYNKVPRGCEQPTEPDEPKVELEVFHISDELNTPVEMHAKTVENTEAEAEVTFESSSFSVFVTVFRANALAAANEITMSTLSADPTLGISGKTVTIKDVAELQMLSNYVSGGNQTTGITFVMTGDADVSAMDGGLTPIGGTSSFSGTFDGGGYTISNLKDSLFGIINGATIKNVNITGTANATAIKSNKTAGAADAYGITTEYGHCGGFAWAAYSDNSFDNCTSNMDLSKQTDDYDGCVGGFVGIVYNGTITMKKCTNLGAVSGTHAGGLIGFCYFANLNDCHNSGTISVKGVNGNPECAGGLIGQSMVNAHAATDTLLVFEDCTNTGTVDASVSGGTDDVGGFVGRAYRVEIEGTDNKNTGNIMGNGGSDGGNGGIVGCIYGKEPYTGYIETAADSKYENTGTIGNSGEYCGGVVGLLEDYTRAYINNVSNSGKIAADYAAGGIIGATDGYGVSVTNATNTGEISSGYGFAGGIFGWWDGLVGNTSGELKFTDCSNSGTVTGEDECGGMVGLLGHDGNKGFFYRCRNSGAVTSTVQDVGGMVGKSYGDEGVFMYDCWNSGTMNANDNGGGLVGECQDILMAVNCYNLGTILGRSTSGAVLGYGDDTAEVYVASFYSSGSAALVQSGYDSLSSDNALVGQASVASPATFAENTMMENAFRNGSQTLHGVADDWHSSNGLGSAYSFQTWGVRNGLAAPGVTLGRDVYLETWLDGDVITEEKYIDAFPVALANNGTVFYEKPIKYSYTDNGSTMRDYVFRGVWAGQYDVYYDGRATGISITMESTDDKTEKLELFTVSFYDKDENGEDILLDTQIVPKNKSQVDYIPAKDGVVFEGWKTEADLPFDQASKITATTKLYAIWGDTNAVVNAVLDDTEPWNKLELELRIDGAIKYTLARDDVDGKYACDELADAGTYDVFLNNKDTGVNLTVPALSTGRAGSAELKGYTLSFLDDSTVLSKQEVVKGLAPETPEKPTKQNYVFTGWKANAGGTTDFDFTAKITQPMSAYASWKESEGLKVILTLNNDSAPWTDAAVTLHKSGKLAYTLTYDSTDKVYTTSKAMDDGVYEIYVNKLDSGSTLAVAENNGTTELHYYTVTFRNRSNSTITSLTQYVPKGKTPEEPAAPTEWGYLFDSWVTESGGSKAFDFSKTITKTTVVYSKWIEATGPMVTLMLNGKAWTDRTVTLRVDNEVRYTLKHSTKGVYTISATVADGTYTVFVGDINTNRSLVITKGSGVVKVTFYSLSLYNEGKLFDTQYVLAGSKPVQPAAPKVVTGATFIGWMTTDNGDTPFDFGEEVGAAVRAYAKWDYEGFKVTGEILHGSLEEQLANYGTYYTGSITMDKGYDYPLRLTAVMGEKPFTDFVYIEPTGTIRINAKTVTGEIVFSGEGRVNSNAAFSVTGEIGHGTLTGNSATNAGGYSGKVKAESGYDLPAVLSASMAGESFGDFSYSSATGAITVAPGVICGDLTFYGVCAGTTAVSYTVSSEILNGVLYGASATSDKGYSGTLKPNNGYSLPEAITATMGGKPFTGFTYYHGSGDITVPASRVTGALVFSGACVSKETGTKYSVIASIGNGTLTGTAAYSGRNYQAVISPDEGYARPKTLIVTMQGRRFTDFSYDPESGIISIAAGRITGNLTIAAVCRNQQSGSVDVGPGIPVIPKK